MKQTTWTDIPFLALPSACQGTCFQTFYVEKEGRSEMTIRCLSNFFAQLFPLGFDHFHQVHFLLNRGIEPSFAEGQVVTKFGLGRLVADLLPGVVFRKIYSQIKSIIVLKLKNSPMGQTTALCDY